MVAREQWRRADSAERAPAVIVAVGNLKGGVGKSTLTVNLAAALAAEGWGAVIVDTDPQQSAVRWSSDGHLPCDVVGVPIRDVGDARLWVETVEELRGQELFILIDLPAVLEAALAAACMLADTVIVPAPPSGLDIKALTRTMTFVENARRQRRDMGPIVHFVPSKVPRRGFVFRRPELGLLHELELPLLPPIFEDADHRKAVDLGRWVGQTAPRSAACRDIVTLRDATLAALARHRSLPAKHGLGGGRAQAFRLAQQPPAPQGLGVSRPLRASV